MDEPASLRDSECPLRTWKETADNPHCQPSRRGAIDDSTSAPSHARFRATARYGMRGSIVPHGLTLARVYIRSCRRAPVLQRSRVTGLCCKMVALPLLDRYIVDASGRSVTRRVSTENLPRLVDELARAPGRQSLDERIRDFHPQDGTLIGIPSRLRRLLRSAPGVWRRIGGRTRRSRPCWRR